MTAFQVFQQSNGEVTKAYYAELQKAGPIGEVAVCLFRAQKTSTRAKLYHGRRYKSAAYDTKNWSLEQLCGILIGHAEQLGITWGWGEDPKAFYNAKVIYIDLPGFGQVSFHSPARLPGPDYAGQWDGKHLSAERIWAFCDSLSEQPARCPTVSIEARPSSEGLTENTRTLEGVQESLGL